MTLVTVSSSYGAGGSVIAPALAEHLGVRFVDRAVAPEVAHELAEAWGGGVFARLLRTITPVATIANAGAPTQKEVDDRNALREAIEEALHQVAAEGDAVILGRAGALALRDVPGALHVRIDGRVDRRLAQAMRMYDIDEAEARRRLHDTDKARERYVRHFYGSDPSEAGLYTLVLDGTVLGTKACVETIAAAAAAYP